jgi:hypothetical protein
MGSKEDTKSQNELSMISKDIFAGTLAGIVGLAATHPIDTIRIRMQLQTYPKIYKTWFHCGMYAVKREGVKGLFKGVVSNSCGSAPIFAVCFAAKEFASRMMAPLQLSEGWNSYIAGCFGGLACCVTTVPAELLKCRAQADKFRFIDYKSSVATIWNQKGITGIYQGWWATVIRDVPCCGFYFWTYETLCRSLIKEDDTAKRKYTIKVIAGGLAGCMDWIPTYPIDVIKTKIQTDKSHTTPGILETVAKYYKLQGIRLFFKGIVPTCILAFPLNAIVFIVYDELIELLG